jgi:sulfur-oxidizing protein SoxX
VRLAAAGLALAALAGPAGAGGVSVVPADAARLPAYEIVGDGIPAPIEGRVGDAARGRAIVADRTVGLCLMCHSGPFPEVRQQGDLAPDLAGAGSRYTAAQLRLRIVDARRLDDGSIMPPYLALEGLQRVQARYRGRTLLDAQQVEDVVAYLETLK